MTSPRSSSRVPLRTIAIVAAVVAAFLLGLFLRGDDGADEGAVATTVADEPTTWTCSMHPQIQLPEPGQCPICFMDLIPLDDGGDDELGPRTLEMTETAAALAEIRTTPVERLAVENRVRLVGKVAYDETRYRTIAAWVAGRIDELFVDFTGTTVKTGDQLASVYSPDLYAAQAELFNALEAQRELERSDQEIMRRTAEATVESARERLRLWGLSAEQVAAMERRGEASHHVTIRAPIGGVVVHKDAVEGKYVASGDRIYTVADLSHVWVDLSAYESDLVWLEEGQTIEFEVEALPGRTFDGTVVFIDPILDDRTRTVTVRLDAENERRLLKPGMFVHAVVNAPVIASGGATDADDVRPPLVIPASAPLLTGTRAVVYVRVPHRDSPTFEGREVQLGPRAGDHYVVASGLEEGERVVVQGAFKLDSALQIQAKPSMMSPDGGAPAAEDGHEGGQAASDDGMAAGRDMTVYSVPDGFQEQVRAVLDGYLALQHALADDDDEAAVVAVGRTEDALGDVDMTLLSGDGHMDWMQDVAALQAALEQTRAAAGIAGRREAFLPLSDRLWSALRRYGYQDDRVIRRFHCPMANDNRGADWIQVDPVTANPYYGAMMLRCGGQTDTLATAGNGGEEG